MYTATFYEPRRKCTFWFFQVRCAHKSCDVIKFIIVACRIYSRLKWYKNYKNRLRLAQVIVKNKMSRFLWFSVYVQFLFAICDIFDNWILLCHCRADEITNINGSNICWYNWIRTMNTSYAPCTDVEYCVVFVKNRFWLSLFVGLSVQLSPEDENAKKNKHAGLYRVRLKTYHEKMQFLTNAWIFLY